MQTHIEHRRISDPLVRTRLVLRWVMELGVIAGLAVWGYQLGSTPVMSTVLAILVPLVGFTIWGLVDFEKVARSGETLRLIEELLLAGIAAAGFLYVGDEYLGWALIIVTVAHHSLVFISGDRLVDRDV